MKTNQNTKGWTAKPENEKKVDPAVKKVHNLIIVDESGSMSSLYNVALEGMNQTLDTIQGLAKECEGQEQVVTLVTFDTNHYNEIFKNTAALQTRPITTQDYRPSGCTPLYDAMGKALTELEPSVKENEAVLVTVITDGYENASSEFSLQDIRALVERLDKAGWMFSYIGANQDAEEVGNSMGIQANLNFDANESSMKQMWAEERNSRQRYIRESRSCDFSRVNYDKKKFFEK